jgi:hypothetical protein
MSQNYFEFDNIIWQQENGTPMGSPISSILAEIFLQHLETKFYPELICKRHTRYMVRYVDDVFIIYDETEATAEDILMDHNNMHPSMKYNLEVEHDSIINFLDLKTYRHSVKILIRIYRKPTFTDVTIPAESNHPMQYKTSAFKYMLDRANKLPTSNEENIKELGIINIIAKNNGYNMKTLMKTYNKHNSKSNISQNTLNSSKKTRAKFTYFGEEIRTLTKIFKKYPIRIAYSTNNTIRKICSLSTQRQI